MFRHIVIIDDSECKRECIKRYMESIAPQAEIHLFGYINPALLFIAKEKADDITDNPSDWLIVSDMMMPRYRGCDIDTKGGQAILRELNRIRFKCPVIIASSSYVSESEMQSIYKYFIGAVEENVTCYNESKYQALIEEYLEE